MIVFCDCDCVVSCDGKKADLFFPMVWIIGRVGKADRWIYLLFFFF